MRARKWITAPDILPLLLLAAVAVYPLACLWLSRSSGEVLTGATGPFAVDQLQYESWIRSAADNAGLAANQFDLANAPAIFVQPMFTLSGFLVALGLPIQLSLLMWLPVAVAMLGVGTVAFVRRHVPAPGWARAVTTTVALFGLSPVVWLLDIGNVRGRVAEGVARSEIIAPGILTWGYFPAAIAGGLVPLCLLGLEKLLEPGRRRPGRSGTWYGCWVAAGGCLAGWLYPWAGTLLVAVMGLVALSGGVTGIRRASLPLIGTTTPLVGYLALSRYTDSWAASAHATSLAPRPILGALVAVLPLAAVAATGASWPSARSAGSSGQRILLAWPVAAAATFLIAPAVPAHLLQTLSVPLAVLALTGLLRRKGPPVVVAAVAAVLVVPGLAHVVDFERESINAEVQAHRLSSAEWTALNALAGDERDGGVLASPYLGAAVPAFTGRDTWVGHPYWTPDFDTRANAADAALDGRANVEQAAAVSKVPALFALLRCNEKGPLPSALKARVTGELRFGCVRILVLDPARAR